MGTPNENIMQCPNCGSTAQVKQQGGPTLSDNGLLLTERFTCGCGCWFEVMYERDESGNWIVHWIHEEVVERKDVEK